ncbi:hypothetical protein [Brevundimonas sp.]|uniref:hypothetical protein n=1 Tax=Brevundimonas sp. TaxID=1871086 RepID=UPI0039E4E19E
MLKFTDPASIAEALNDPNLDQDLLTLLRCLAFDLSDGGEFRIVVVQEGDGPAVINNAADVRITGDSAEELSFDWIKDHEGQWFEIRLSPIDGVPTRILVDNGPGTELGIHYLCLSHFWPENDGGDR